MRWIAVIGLTGLWSPIISGQVLDVQDSTDTISPEVESVLTEETERAEDSDLASLLSDLEEHPLDLNEASGDELEQIPGMHELIVARILKRRATARFTSIDELKEIEGISELSLRTMRPYITVSTSKARLSVPTVELRSRITLPTHRSLAFITHRYVGSALKSYNRLRMRSSLITGDRAPLTIQLGCLTEKDAGERMGDFLTGFLEVSSSRFRILVGDYSVESAAGLVYPKQYGGYAGADVFSAARRGSRIRGYVSTGENFFYRGLVLEGKMGWVTLDCFVSNKRVNGSVDSAGSLTALDQSGMFRTMGEQARKGAEGIRTFGGLVTLSPGNSWSAGAKFFATELPHPPILKKKPYPRVAGGVGFDVRFSRESWSIFGETAVDRKGVSAVEGGVQLEPCRWLSLLVGGQFRPPALQNVFWISFGNPASQSLHVGMDLHVVPGLRIRCSAYREFDGWNNEVSPFPVSAERRYIGIEGAISRNTIVDIELKEKKSSVSIHSGTALTDMRRQQNIRLTVSSTPSHRVRLRSRLDAVFVDYDHQPSERGLVLLQDIHWSSGPVSCSGRIAFFETVSYDSRLYEYETGLRGAFEVPALYGRGVRSAVLFSWSVSAGITVGAKYSVTVRDGVRSIGSGLDEIQGDSAGRVSLQLDVRY